MKLGMPILYEFNTMEENILLAKKLGLDFIELNLNFSYCQKALEEKDTLIKLLNDNNIEATLHFYDEADFALYDEVVLAYTKLFEKYLTLSKDYIKIVNVHLNEGPVVTIAGVKNYIYDKEYETYINRLHKNLTTLKTLCDNYNVRLVLENTKFPNYMKKTYEDLIKLDYSFNFDIGHDATCGYSLLELSKACNDIKFNEFHIHDSKDNLDHLALGCGKLDIKMYKEMAIKHDAYVLIEVKSASDLVQSIPYFKKL